MAVVDTLVTFAARVTGWQRLIGYNNRRVLDRAGRLVVSEARSAIGTYKYGWPRLSARTVARKRMGDSPLLETGGLRASYGHTVVSNDDVQVGSDDPKATWHELGTRTIPPRPVIVPAAQAKEPEVARMFERHLISQFGFRAE